MRWGWVNFQCRGVLLIWIRVGQGPTTLAAGAGGGCPDIFSLVYHFSFLSPSLWETARYRLKYCLKGPLTPIQPTNQPKFNIKTHFWHGRCQWRYMYVRKCCYTYGHRYLWNDLIHWIRATLYNKLIYVGTVNPVYNDIRYNSKIRYNVNLVRTKISGTCIFFIVIHKLFFRKTRRGDSNKYTKRMIHKNC